MKNVLWLAPYPYHVLRYGDYSVSHPAPWVSELAQEISDKVNLTIVNYSEKVEGKVEEFQNNGIRFIFLKSPRLRYDVSTLYRVRIKRFLKFLVDLKSDYDLIHVHGTEHQYEYIAEKLDIPYIISLQGLVNKNRLFYPTKLSGFYMVRLVTSFYERFGISRARYFFCRTDYDTGYVKEMNAKAKVFVTWEVIRNHFFNDLFNEKSKKVLFLGGTKIFKGVRETLLAVNLLKEQKINVVLQICGHGSSDEVKAFIKKRKLLIDNGDVEFLGFQSADQLANLFREAFCLIHPSYMDNSPNSICEAQVAGLPVVATNVGGVSSLIDNGKTGLLVDRKDYFGIAEQVRGLLEDKNLYCRISRVSREVARRRHNRERIISATLKAYEEVISSS